MSEYESLVNSNAVVMIEFYATWCQHCQRMMPVVAQIRELMGGSAEIYQIDVDQYPEVSDEVGVHSTPTFIIYSHGREIWRYSGEIDGNVLLQKLQSAMS